MVSSHLIDVMATNMSCEGIGEFYFLMDKSISLTLQEMGRDCFVCRLNLLLDM